MTDLTHRARGALIGLAVGDAVGTTLEFKPRDSGCVLTDMIGGGPFGLEPGVWTDDTSMALALGESLDECDGFDAADLMSRFVDWWCNGNHSPTGECFDIGITTRHALAKFAREGDPFAGSRSPDAAGNGSLMRLSPVAIWGVNAGEIAMREVARAQSSTTHAARACLDACEAYSVTLRGAIMEGDFEKALAGCSGMDLVQPIASIVSGSWRGKTRDEIASSGYVAHSLEAALWCVGQGGNFREMVLRAANLGDDADTTAAITGQLAGALFGATGIPQGWLAKLAWYDRIESLADRLLEAKSHAVS